MMVSEAMPQEWQETTAFSPVCKLLLSKQCKYIRAKYFDEIEICRCAIEACVWASHLTSLWLTKVHLVKAMVFPVVMYGCESCTIKKAERRRIDAFELWCWRRLLRVPWTARRSNQSVLKEIDQSWVFIGRTDAEAETPILWPLDVKNWLIGKDPDAGKDWGREEKGTTEEELVRWHYRLNGHGFEQALGVGDGQGSLVCCSLWGRKESDTTERLNWCYIILP